MTLVQFASCGLKKPKLVEHLLGPHRPNQIHQVCRTPPDQTRAKPTLSRSHPPSVCFSLYGLSHLIAVRSKPASFINLSLIKQRSTSINGTEKRSQFFLATKAVEETQGSSESANVGEVKPELSELGSEIKKAMEERKAAEKEEGFLDGVAEEIRKIEWPAFGKVLGTTGVVLGVIAGSSVVLLTLNFVLAELSDQLFAGKGVQDFFS
uniref:Preprotein translocase subunit SECE1 n=1 Tax=Cannabis sativa TaxID=3483 RepID=A0A803Q1Q2_CANSA